MADAVFVGLGAGLERKNPGDPPYMWIGTETELRAAAVAKLWKQTPNSVIIFSGAGLSDPNTPTEAEAMEDYVKRPPWNVPGNLIYTDNTSIDTASNVKNVAAMIKQKNFPTNNIQLVAGRSNVERAAAYFKAWGLHVTQLLARPVLGDDIQKYGLPTVSDDPTWQSRFHEFLLRAEQLIDRKGTLVTMYKRWLNRK